MSLDIIDINYSQSKKGQRETEKKTKTALCSSCVNDGCSRTLREEGGSLTLIWGPLGGCLKNHFVSREEIYCGGSKRRAKDVFLTLPAVLWFSHFISNATGRKDSMMSSVALLGGLGLICPLLLADLRRPLH